MANITGEDEIYLPRTPLFDVVSIVCSIGELERVETTEYDLFNLFTEYKTFPPLGSSHRSLEHLLVKTVVSANPVNANFLEIPGVLGWSVAP